MTAYTRGVSGSGVPGSRRPTRLAEGREAEIFAWGERDVLRLYRDPTRASAADCELLALAAVRSVLPRVPAPRGRMDLDGRPGILMERLDGHGLFAELTRRPWRVVSLARLTGRIHAELNGVRAPAGLPELRHEVKRRIEALADVPELLRASALDELARLPDGDALCHGDFHPENVILCPDGPVVIDWPTAARGDACADFARSTVMLRVGSLPPGTPALIRVGRHVGSGLYRRAYRAGYAQIRRYDDSALRRWQFVRAVDRFADGIVEERAGLLREAERLRRGLPRAGG